MRSVKSWYWVHKWTSLVCTAFMLLLCITGLPLIFHHEIDHALGHAVDPPVLAETVGPASIDVIVDDARSRNSDHAVQFLVKDADEPELVFVSMGATIDSTKTTGFYTYDGRTGELLGEYPVNEGLMNVLLRLHIDLFAGLPGMLFLGFMGLLLIASIISGAVLYGSYMRKLPFGMVRRERSARLKWLDLHNLLGIVTLVWLMVVGVTGVLNTLSIPIFNHWQSGELADMLARHEGEPGSEMGSPERALAAAVDAAPAMELSFMAFPGNPWAGSHHFVAYMEGTTPLTSRLITPFVIDGRRGEVVAAAEMPWYITALMGSRPLHFGDYGGLPLKMLWAILDILSIVVLASGLYLWLKRHRVSFETWLQSVQARAPRAERVAA